MNRDPARRVLVVEGRSRKAVAVVRSLARAGFSVTVTSETPLAPARASRGCRRFVAHPSPRRDPEGFLRRVLDELAREPYELVLPMEGEGLEVLSPRRDRLPARTAFPFAPDEVMRRAADKAAVAALAESIGVPSPRSALPESEAALEPLARAIGFPLVLKPCVGQGSHGVARVDDFATLRARYPETVRRFGPAMLQAYVPPGGELGTSMLFGTNGALLARFSHRRIRSYPVAGGPSTLRESAPCPETEVHAERLLRALDWRGVAMVEFRRDPRDGRAKLIEINHRFWGSLALAIAAGVDFPLLLCRDALGETVAPVLAYPTGVQCRWLFPGDLMHFLANPNRWRMRPSFFRFFGRNLHYDIESLEDPGPALAAVLDVLMQATSPARWRAVTRRDQH